MPINDPQAVKYSNERIRPLANELARLYYYSRLVLDEWVSRGMPNILPNINEEIVDGARADGRPIIYGTDANDLINYVSVFVNDMEANNKQKLARLLKIASNPELRRLIEGYPI